MANHESRRCVSLRHQSKPPAPLRYMSFRKSKSFIPAALPTGSKVGAKAPAKMIAPGFTALTRSKLPCSRRVYAAGSTLAIAPFKAEIRFVPDNDVLDLGGIACGKGSRVVSEIRKR